MPDNYIALGKIPRYKEFISRAYPGSKDRIDKFGVYVDEPGTRVAGAPYTIYF